MSNLDIEEVKKYNATLRAYKDKSNQIMAEIEFNKNELARQCKELSAEIGIEVTPDNVKSVLEQYVAKINNTMAVGNEILNRIKADEANSVNSSEPSVINTGNIGSLPEQLPQFSI